MMKKAQSALEYLMTYGIAIVAIVIVIGLLFAFGFFQPCKLTGASVSGVPVNSLISNPKMDTNQNLSFNFKAVGKDSIGIISASMSYGVGAYGNATGTGTAAFNGTVVASGTTSIVAMSSNKSATGWSQGSCQTLNLFILYNLSSDTTPRNYSMTPTITLPVQAP